MSQPPRRVAVLSRSFSRHPILRNELMSRCPATKFNDAGASLSGEALLDFVAGSDGLIVALERIDATTLAKMPDLRVLSKYGVGIDNVDLAAASRLGIRVGWSGGVNRRSVAELTIAMMISLSHLVPQAGHEVRSGLWRQIMGRDLTGRTVGIVGCGHVGQEVVSMLEPFKCRVRVHDIRPLTHFCETSGAIHTDLKTLVKESEIVSIHLPATNLTSGLFDAALLDCMRRGALLVNAARGGIVDEAALKDRLKDGRIGGAAFDVFTVEPPSDRELLSLPNMLVTPHIGGSTEESVLAMGRAAIDGLFNARDPLEDGYIPEWLR